MTSAINLDLIKQKRLEKGYSNSDMARMLKLRDKVAYYRRENGDYKFQATELPFLSKALDIPLANFFTFNVSKIETNAKRKKEK